MLRHLRELGLDQVEHAEQDGRVRRGAEDPAAVSCTLRFASEMTSSARFLSSPTFSGATLGAVDGAGGSGGAVGLKSKNGASASASGTAGDVAVTSVPALSKAGGVAAALGLTLFDSASPASRTTP